MSASRGVFCNYRLSLVAFWFAAAFVFVMATLPPPVLPGPENDKIQHIVAFAVLTALGIAAYSWTYLKALLVGLIAFGALIEVIQAIPALHRDSDWRDLVADTFAVFAVLLAYYVIRLIRRR